MLYTNAMIPAHACVRQHRESGPLAGFSGDETVVSKFAFLGWLYVVERAEDREVTGTVAQRIAPASNDIELQRSACRLFVEFPEC